MSHVDDDSLESYTVGEPDEIKKIEIPLSTYEKIVKFALEQKTVTVGNIIDEFNHGGHTHYCIRKLKNDSRFTTKKVGRKCFIIAKQ